MCLYTLIPGLLEKSLQVLTSSNVLLQKLRELQRTEALQRRGGVLQDEEAEEEEVNLWSFLLGKHRKWICILPLPVFDLLFVECMD